MPSCTRHTWASVCLLEQMCVCLLSQSPVCAVPSSPDDGFVCIFNCSYMHAFVHSSYVSERICTSRCVYVCCINNKFVLFHLALMMDLCVFSISFMHLSYVSECVLAWAHVCLFAKWMLFVVLSSPDDGFVFFNFSYMHAFVQSSYVSERVLARADVCMFAVSITSLCCSI